MMQTPTQNEKRKKYDRELPGIVESIEDPLGLLRVQVRVLGLFTGPVETLPWAEYKLPVGVRPNEGSFIPVQVGDYVWVDFPYDGDTRRPRITGGLHYCPDDAPNLPHEAWEGPDKTEHKRTGSEPEPASPEYHKTCVYSQSGVIIEVGKPSEASEGYFRVTQKRTGTAIEIAPDGSITLHSEQSLFISSPGSLEAVIGGDASIEAGGDISIETSGDVSVEAAGQVNAKGSMVNLN